MIAAMTRSLLLRRRMQPRSGASGLDMPVPFPAHDQLTQQGILPKLTPLKKN